MTQGQGLRRARVFSAMALEGDARSRIVWGAGLLARVVAPTLGPGGRPVLCDRARHAPAHGINGYRLAMELDVAEPTARIGIKALRELAWQMFDAHGDGTAAAILIANSVLGGTSRALAAGLSIDALQRALGDLLSQTEESLVGQRIEVSQRELLDAVCRSAGDDAAGRLIADAWSEVGIHGQVLVEKGCGREDRLEFESGLTLSEGLISPAFVTDTEREVAEYDDVHVLVAEGRIADFSAIAPALAAFAKSAKPLLILAENIAGEALATLTVNRQRGGLNVVAAKIPGNGPWKRRFLEDAAIVTGATLIGTETGSSLELLRPAMIGFAKRVVVSRRNTIILGGRSNPEQLCARRNEIRADMEKSRHLAYDREQHGLRLARLGGGVARILLGAATASGIEARVSNLAATSRAAHSALRHGALAGGGHALLAASRSLFASRLRSTESQAARRILTEALSVPARIITANLGALDEHAKASTRSTRKKSCVVLDPLPVIRDALSGAVATGLRFGSVALSLTSQERAYPGPAPQRSRQHARPID